MGGQSRRIFANQRCCRSTLITAVLAVAATLATANTDEPLLVRQDVLVAGPAFPLPMPGMSVMPTTQPEVEAVFVRDAASISSRIAQARQLAAAGDWARASDEFQELLEKYADRLVLRPDAEANGMRRYERLTAVLGREMSAWPLAGVQAYTERFEPAAKLAVDQALANLRDCDGADRIEPLARLSALIERYPISAATAQAACVVADELWSNGEASSAAHLAESIAVSHPAPGPAGQMAALRWAAMSRQLGDTAASARAMARLAEIATPDFKWSVGNEDLTPAVAIERLFPAKSFPAAGGADSETPADMTGGDSPTIPTARVSVFPLGEARLARASAAVRSAAQRQQNAAAGQNAGAGVTGKQTIPAKVSRPWAGIPVTKGSTTFVNIGTEVLALQADSGQPLAGWGAAVSPAQRPQGRQMDRSTPLGRSVLISGGRLLSVVGPTGQWQLGVTGNSPAMSSIVCQSPQDGRVLWSFSTAKLAPAPEAQVELTGTPVVVGNLVITAGIALRGGEFYDCHLTAVDLATGKHRWTHFVCSAAAGMSQWSSELTDVPVPTLAAVGQSVIFQTNLGAVACVDSNTGDVRWLTAYPRRTQIGSGGGNGPVRVRVINGLRPVVAAGLSNGSTQRPIWAVNNPLVWGDVVGVLPDDAVDLAILSVEDGSPVRRLPRATLGNPDTLLSLSGARLVTASRTEIRATDVKLRREGVAAQPSLLWSAATNGQLDGRPAVDGHFAYLPCSGRLTIIDIVSGLVQAIFPAGPNRWPEGEGGGNVAVGGGGSGTVTIASGDRLTVLGDLANALGIVTRQIQADPGNAALRGRMFSLLWTADRPDEAIKALTEVMAQAVPGTPLADQLFAESLIACKQTLNPSAIDTSPQATAADAAQKLLAGAEHLIANDTMRLRWLAMAVTAATTRQDAVGQLARLQDLLEVLLRTPAPPDGLNRVDVAARIRAAVQSAGPDAYAPYADRARQEVAAKPDDALAVLAAMRKYPAWHEGPLQVVAAIESRPETDRAVLVDALDELDRVYRESAVVDAPVLLGRLQLAARIPARESLATHIANELAIRFPSGATTTPLRLSEGGTLAPQRHAQIAAALGARSDALLARLPHLGLPDSQQIKAIQAASGRRPEPFTSGWHSQGFINVINTKSPNGGQPDPLLCTGLVPRRLVPNAAQPNGGNPNQPGVVAIDPATGKTLWTYPMLTQQALMTEQAGARGGGGGGATGGVVLLGNNLVMLDREGHHRWTVSPTEVRAAMPPGSAIDAIGQTNIFTSLVSACLVDDVIICSENQSVFAVDSATGKVLWASPYSQGANNAGHTLYGMDGLAVVITPEQRGSPAFGQSLAWTAAVFSPRQGRLYQFELPVQPGDAFRFMGTTRGGLISWVGLTSVSVIDVHRPRQIARWNDEVNGLGFASTLQQFLLDRDTATIVADTGRSVRVIDLKGLWLPVTDQVNAAVAAAAADAPGEDGAEEVVNPQVVVNGAVVVAGVAGLGNAGLPGGVWGGGGQGAGGGISISQIPTTLSTKSISVGANPTRQVRLYPAGASTIAATAQGIVCFERHGDRIHFTQDFSARSYEVVDCCVTDDTLVILASKGINGRINRPGGIGGAFAGTNLLLLDRHQVSGKTPATESGNWVFDWPLPAGMAMGGQANSPGSRIMPRDNGLILQSNNQFHWMQSLQPSPAAGTDTPAPK